MELSAQSRRLSFAPALSAKLPSAEESPARLDSGNRRRPSGRRIGAKAAIGVVA